MERPYQSASTHPDIIDLPYDFDLMGHSDPVRDLEVLRYLVKELGHPWIVEIGSWAGMSARCMLQAGAYRVYCVDPWTGYGFDRNNEAIDPAKAYQTFLRNNRAMIPDRIVPCVGTSALWASIWHKQVDMVFIDGDHSYESARADIEMWMPHIQSGGIIAVHDYASPDYVGVKQAVDELLPNKRVEGFCMAWMKVDHAAVPDGNNGAVGRSELALSR